MIPSFWVIVGPYAIKHGTSQYLFNEEDHFEFSQICISLSGKNSLFRINGAILNYWMIFCMVH